MAGPFFNNIGSISSGTAGSGAFTPSTAVGGFLAWSTVPTGWIGLVRFEDGTDWELRYSYWNGTTLSRTTNAFVASSTGSALTLTSAAVAKMPADAADIMPHLGGTAWRLGVPILNSTGGTVIGAAVTTTGTAAGVNLATTNFLTEQQRAQYTSATTANAQAGWSSAVIAGIYSTASGRGGFEYAARFGASQLPTGPRLLCGMTTVTFVGSSGDPSALAASIAAFAKDSADTNIQFLTKDGTTAHKIDTGIPLAANGWYEASVWADPGGGKVYGLLIRLDTGDIWFGSTVTNLPANGSLLLPMVVGGLSSTTGTAIIMQIGSLINRTGY